MKIDVENTDSQTSDHRLVKIITRMLTQTSLSTNSLRTDAANLLDSLNFWSDDIDWCSIKSHLQNHDWDDYMRTEDISKKAEMLVSIIEDASVLFVPPKIIKNRSMIPRDRRLLFNKRKNIN